MNEATKTPLRAAMEAGDPEAIADAFADEVTVVSPIFDVPFEGKRRATDLFVSISEVLDDLEYVDEIPGVPHVLHGEAKVKGTPLEFIELLRFDEQGKVREMTVLLRPFPGIAAFMGAISPRIGRRFRGGGTATALRVLGGPPSLMMRSVARLGPRLLRLRGERPG